MKSADSEIQRIHKENADRMLLASFVSGLTSTAGYQVKILHTESLGKALNIAVFVQEQRDNNALMKASILGP